MSNNKLNLFNHFSIKSSKYLMIYQIFDWFTNKMSTACKISYFSANIRCTKAFFSKTVATMQKKNYFCSTFVKTIL